MLNLYRWVQTPNSDWYKNRGQVSGAQDPYVSKFDSDGNYQWARTWGAGYDDQSWGVVFTDNNNILVLTWFAQTVDFDPGPGVVYRSSKGDSHDIALSEFDKDGNFISVINWGGYGQERAYRVERDATGNILVPGSFSQNVDFDPGTGVYELVSNGDTDAFLLKLDPYGEFLWIQGWGGEGADGAIDVALDQKGNAGTSGYFSSSVDFNPGPAIDEHTSNGGEDIFLTKFGPNGGW